MSIYLLPIRSALIAFPFIAALFVLPVYIYQYRKFGFVNKLRIFAFYAFILYLMCAYFEVILPLPNTRDIISLYGTNRQTYDLTLFSSIQDIIHETQVIPSNPATYLHLFRERAFLQLAFNIILTIPFGIFMRYLFNRNFKQTVFFSFLLTLFFELSQLTGLFWIYNAPYRLFSVDDLLFNTIGGILGYLITPLITAFIPTLQQIDSQTVLPTNVGTLRRLAALAVDWIMISFLTLVLNIMSVKAIPESLITFITVSLYFIVLPAIAHGYTVGKKLVRIRLSDDHGNLPLGRLILRTYLFYGVTMGLNPWINSIANYFTDDLIIQMGAFILTSGIGLLLIVNFLGNLRSHIFFHDKLSGIHNVVVDKK